MIRSDRGGFARSLLLAFWVCVAGCKAGDGASAPTPAGAGGKGGSAAAGAGGAGGGGSGGQTGSGGRAGSEGFGGAGGSVTSTDGAGGGTGGAAGGSSEGAGGARSDAPGSVDGTGPDLFAEGDYLPNRPDLRICKKEWTAEQCCAFLCRCLSSICSDSPKGKPGIGTCGTWCPKLGDMARRCHVYHCFVSISPTGGIKDHDSHCGHAADQVAGGGCPVEVYQK